MIGVGVGVGVTCHLERVTSVSGDFLRRACSTIHGAIFV